MSNGPEYVVASRQGLYIVDHTQWRLVAEGVFFGVTLRDGDIYCFKTVELDHDPQSLNLGAIVRYRRHGDAWAGPEILIPGIDRYCHQIDFFDGMLFVVDTNNQRILEFDSAWQLGDSHQLLPPITGPNDDAHINSFLAMGDTIHVLFHNNKRGIPSEIVEYDRAFRERARHTLCHASCHDVVRLEDGSLLYCDSQNGTLNVLGGMAVKIDELFTRGLAVGADEIAVGSSFYGYRLVRTLLPGFVTFLDRSYNRIARLYIPAAPTQIRRLDGADLSLSRPRVRLQV